MGRVRALVAILSGKAIVLIKRGEHEADVLVGRDVSKHFAISSMVGAVKAML